MSEILKFYLTSMDPCFRTATTSLDNSHTYGINLAISNTVAFIPCIMTYQYLWYILTPANHGEYNIAPSCGCCHGNGKDNLLDLGSSNEFLFYK